MAIRKRTWLGKNGEERQAWVVDYKDGAGKRRLKTFKRKKDAEHWWQNKAAPEIQAGTHVADSASISVEEAGKDWIRFIELEGREQSTLDQYNQHLTLHINPRIGAEKLSRLTTPRVQAFRDELLRDLSRSLAKKVLTSLKSLLKDAQRRGNIGHNPALPVSITDHGRLKAKLRVGVDIPSREDIRLILAHAEGRWRPLLATAIFTGMRASELRGLAWGNVDFDARVIHVRQRADRYNQIGPPKSEAGERSIPMSPMLLNTLKEWQREYPRPVIGDDKDGNPIREEYQPHHLVFPNGLGKVEKLENIRRRGLEATQFAAGMTIDTGKVDKDGKPILAPKYGMHSLRHFYASWCINRKSEGGLGLTLTEAQERLGHSSVTMTSDVYGHLFPSDDTHWEDLEQAEKSLWACDKDATKSNIRQFSAV